jgi:hypothetical protein
VRASENSAALFFYSFIVSKQGGMKTLLLFILSSILLGTATQAQESSTTTDEANPLKVGLTARVRWEDAYNKDMIGGVSDFMSVRLRPSVSYTLSPQASAFFEAQYAKAFGQGTYNDLLYSGGTPNSGGANTTSGSAKYPGDNLYVRQGYLALNFNPKTSLLVGRQALSYGDENIVGLSDWGLFGRTFDAARAHWSDGKSFVDLMNAQVKQLYVDQNNQTAGDKSFSGIYASWNASENWKKVEAYYFYQGDNGATTAGQSSHFGVWGTRVVTSWNRLDAKAEFAQNFGTGGAGATSGTASPTTTVANDRDTMLDVEVAWNFSPDGKNRLGLEYFSAGKNWTDFYPGTHLALGQSDILGRRDLTGFGVHYKILCAEKWQSGLDYYYFQKTKTEGQAYATDSVSAIGTGTSTSKNLGQEIDLSLKYQMDSRVSFTAGYAHFMLGSGLKDVGTNSSAAHYGSLMMEAKYP